MCVCVSLSWLLYLVWAVLRSRSRCFCAPSSKRACLCLGWRSLGAHAPVRPILQTAVDPSSDRASLCAQATLSLSEITTCWNMRVCMCFFYFGPSGGKPFFVTILGRCHFGPHSWLLRSDPESRCQSMRVVTCWASMAVKKSWEKSLLSGNRDPICSFPIDCLSSVPQHLQCVIISLPFYFSQSFKCLKLFIFPFQSNFLASLGFLPHPLLFSITST